MALGITGTAYGAWSDILAIGATVNMGTIGAEVTCDGCSPAGIQCSVVGSNELELTVTCAEVEVTYSCPFNITNTGTIPVTVQQIIVTPVTPATLPEGVVVVVPAGVAGIPIDAGGVLPGVVQVSLTPEPPANPSEGTNFTFNVTFEFVPWNQYSP